jgi:hypothetical protein
VRIGELPNELIHMWASCFTSADALPGGGLIKELALSLSVNVGLPSVDAKVMRAIDARCQSEHLNVMRGRFVEI